MAIFLLYIAGEGFFKEVIRDRQIRNKYFINRLLNTDVLHSCKLYSFFMIREMEKKIPF